MKKKKSCKAHWWKSSKYCCQLQTNEQKQTAVLQETVKLEDKRRNKFFGEKKTFLEKKI